VFCIWRRSPYSYYRSCRVDPSVELKFETVTVEEECLACLKAFANKTLPLVLNIQNISTPEFQHFSRPIKSITQNRLRLKAEAVTVEETPLVCNIAAWSPHKKTAPSDACLKTVISNVLKF
jgi:hypothetical protein